MIKGKVIVGQSGGPTSVINASLAGIVKRSLLVESITHILGLKNGVEGLLNEEFYNLGNMEARVFDNLCYTPSSALGSTRYKLKDEDLPRILEVFKHYDIHGMFLIGGNDTMETIFRIEAYCKAQEYPFRGIGVPKTVDNDLFGTYFTPGFPSAARSNILNVLQAGILARDMRKVDQFVVYQTIGREAGWLAAATALAQNGEGSAPHLIYCPELPFDPDRLVKDTKKCIEKHGYAFLVVSEGLRYADGTPVSSSSTKDNFNNVEFGATGGGSVALSIHRILSERLQGCRGEFQIPESAIMSASDRIEQQDLDMALLCGRRAVELAIEGVSGVMVTVQRKNRSFSLDQIPLKEAANTARTMPREYINEAGNGVTKAFLDYMTPLISPLPSFEYLPEVYYKE